MKLFARTRAEPTVVQLRRLDAPVTYAESEVYYDAWGTPYVKANLYGYGGAPYDLILRPGGKVSDGAWNTQWRHKSGEPVAFPKQVSERQARGWTPDESPPPPESGVEG